MKFESVRKVVLGLCYGVYLIYAIVLGYLYFLLVFDREKLFSIVSPDLWYAWLTVGFLTGGLFMVFSDLIISYCKKRFLLLRQRRKGL